MNVEVVAAVVLLLIVPCGCAVLLRAAGCPGWALVGGVVAGIVLGPTIVGRAAPSVHERIFVGGMAEREQLQQLHGRQGADLLAAEYAGADRELLSELRQQHVAERAAAEDSLRSARWAHQQPQRWLVVGVVALTLLGAGVTNGRRVSSVAGGTGGALVAGLWTATVPGATAAICCTWWWRLSPGETAIVTAAVIMGPWALSRADRLAAERVQRGGSMLVVASGAAATGMGLLVAGWGLWRIGGTGYLLWLVPLAMALAGWAWRARRTSSSDLVNKALRRAVVFVMLPAMAAAAAVKIDAIDHFALWPALALVLISGDGRWLGAVTGIMLHGGRTAMQAMKLSLGAMASGPTQLAVVAIAANVWLLDETILLGLVAGAVYVEISEPLRRQFAQMR